MRALIVLLALGGVASADDEIVHGAVVRIEAKEIYVSLGSNRGVQGGAALRIKRAITLRHPITHAPVSDWIPIASAKVTEAGTEMSRAVIGDFIGEIKVGDIAEVLVDRPDAPRVVVQGPVAPPVDAATAEVLGELTAQAGQPIDVRIAGWEHYLSIRPSSRYSAGIRRELDELRALREQMRMPGTVHGADQIATITHTAPTVARAGVPLPLAFVLDQPDRVASAYLHYRLRGALTYRAVLLTRDNRSYLHGNVPAAVVAAPGIDYFVEVAAPNGTSGLALGTPAAPIGVAVKAPTVLDEISTRSAGSEVRFTADSLDFGTFDHRTGDRTDHLYTATLDFTYRLHSLIESFGVGAGVYSGTGGFRDAMWTEANPAPTSGFHYGYADMEAGDYVDGIHVAVGGQIIAGVGKTGFGLGGEGRLRIGERDGTNVVFLGRTIDQVGYLSAIKFGTRVAQPLGLAISVGATDQPNQGDTAVVLGTELELYAIRNVSLIARGSWQGRSVDHGGVGGGGGVAFNW